ncbi:hypothetical protein PENTCL1PPCAC_27491, partial [Pristionchus entomophagus]
AAAAPAARRSPSYGQSPYVNRPYPGGQLRSQSISVQAVPPDSVCGSDADCAGYPLAFCDGVCRCVAGALNAGSTCISNGNSVSVSGTCPPGQSYVTEAGSCMTTAIPGEPCQYSQQCSATEAGAFCLRLKCECVYGMKQSGSGCTFADTNCAKRGFIWIPELGECKEVIPPGGRGCSHNLQCASSFPGSTCFLQTCSCPSSHPVAIDGTCGRNCTAGLTYSGVTGQCLPTVQPGDQCLYSSQCHSVHPGIGCDRGRCRCPRDEVFTGNGCAITCPSGYRANSRGICSPGCRSNQVEHEGECLDASVAGQACVVNAQCTGGSSCQDSLCKCTRGMTARGGICVAIESAPLGSCANGEICGGGSFCSNGNCTCPVGRQVLNGRCVTPITVSPGANCLRSGVVCGGNSFCVRGTCHCRAGQQPFDGVCMHELTADAGSSCARGETCVGGTVCNAISRVCECANSQEMAIGNRCVRRLQSHPGYPCGNGEVCVGGSMCHHGRCECPDGSQQDGKQCTTTIAARPGESCASGEVCEGGSNCMPKIFRCTCPMGEQIVFGHCTRVVDAQPGFSCGGAAIRCTGGSFCNSNGQCTCPVGTHAEGGYCRPAPVPLSITVPTPSTSKTTIVAPGEDCDANTHCGSGTVCLRGICQCPQGLSPDGRCLSTATTASSTNRGTRGRATTPAATPPPTLMTTTTSTSRAGARRMVAAGGSCSSSDLCTGRSFCAQGACRCAAPFEARAGSCTPPVSSQVAAPSTIGSRCSVSSDCPSSSVCNGGYCACPPGMTRASPIFCSVVSTTTSTTTARTTTTTTASSTTAQPTAAPFLRPCSQVSQPCPQPAAACSSSSCGCRPGYRLIGSTHCMRIVQGEPYLSEPMPEYDFYPTLLVPAYDPQPFVPFPHVPPVLLPEQFAPPFAVQPGWLQPPPQQLQLPVYWEQPRRHRSYKRVMSSAPGESCVSSIFCEGGAHCAGGVCVCPPGQRFIGGKCQPPPIVPPGSYCVNGEVCSGNSHCVGGFCFCPAGHALQGGKCIQDEGKDSKGAGDFFSSPAMRISEDLKSMGRLMARKEEMRKKMRAPMEEIQLADLGEACTRSSVVCTRGSHCVGGRCQCPPGHRPLDGTCVPIGRRCLAANQCPSGADCIQGECKCTQGLTLSRFGFCIPVTYAGSGESCPQGTQCRGGAICAYGRCECPPEHDVREGKCSPRGLSLSPPSSTYSLHYDSRPGALSPCPGDGSCALPECLCSSSGTAPPSSLLVSQTPQMIVITFEGAVTDRTTRIYKSLFSGRLRSHDCPLRATFFVSHEYTNYDQVQWLAARGNEIGVAGMGSSSLASRSADRWREEMQGMRMALAEFSKIEEESIRGVRAPGMKTGGDSQFAVLSNWNFTYDHSIAPDGGPFWPQTLDHTLPFLCTDGSCPSKAFKGIWEAPVNRIITTDGRAVARLRDAIRSTDTRASVTDLLRRNLARNYQGSRAPLVLSLDADFMFALPQNEAVNGLIDFLEEALTKDDIYPVTVSQLISWMKSPTSLDRIAKFKPFHCPRRANDQVQPCETPSTCSFVTPQGSRSFRVCGSCPRDYPNIDDPLGKGRR